jgi:hypothetical protein
MVIGVDGTLGGVLICGIPTFCVSRVLHVFSLSDVVSDGIATHVDQTFVDETGGSSLSYCTPSIQVKYTHTQTSGLMYGNSICSTHR